MPMSTECAIGAGTCPAAMPATRSTPSAASCRRGEANNSSSVSNLVEERHRTKVRELDEDCSTVFLEYTTELRTGVYLGKPWPSANRGRRCGRPQRSPIERVPALERATSQQTDQLRDTVSMLNLMAPAVLVTSSNGCSRRNVRRDKIFALALSQAMGRRCVNASGNGAVAMRLMSLTRATAQRWCWKHLPDIFPNFRRDPRDILDNQMAYATLGGYRCLFQALVYPPSVTHVVERMFCP